MLIESAANVNVRGYFETVKLLLESGASVNEKDNDGWTPLDYGKKK